MTSRPPTGGPGRRRRTRPASQGEQGLNRMDKVDTPARAAKTVAKPVAPAGARRKASGNGTARKVVGVLVLGMHRSGTSALTRVLNLLGCALPSDLLGGNESNPEGHWESLRAIEINDTLLQALGRRWDDIRELPADWMQRPEAEVARTQIRGFLDKEFGGQKLWVLKDPRLCRLAPLWLEVMDEMGMDARIVLPVRHPGEVAYSLARRDGFTTGRSVLLWLQHVTEAERASRGRPRVLVHHQDLMANWRGEADTIRRELGLTWPARGRNNTQIDEFVRPQLAHSDAQAGDPAATRVPLPPQVMRLYGELLANDDDKAWTAIERAANTIGKAASIFLPGIEDLSLRIEQRERETAAAMVALKAGVGDPEMWRRNSAALETLVKENAVGFNKLAQSQPLLHELIRQIEAQRKEVGPVVKEQSHALQALRAEARQASGDLLGHVDGRLTDFGEYVQELRRQVAQLRQDADETSGQVPPLVHEVIRQLEAQRHELGPAAQTPALVHEVIAQVEAQRNEFGPLIDQLNGLLRRHGDELGPTLQRQAQQLARLAEHLGERDEQLQKLHGVAFERQAQLTHMANVQTRLEMRLKGLENDRTALQATVAEREAALEAATAAHAAALQRAVAERDTLLAQRDAQLAKLVESHKALVTRFEQVDAERAAKAAELVDTADMLSLAEQEIASREFHAHGMRDTLNLRILEVRQLQQRVEELEQHLLHVEHQRQVKKQQIEAHEQHIAALEQTVADAGKHIDGLRDILAERENRLADMHRTLEQSRRDLDEAREKIGQMAGSRSWKITAPLRAFNAMRRGGKPPATVAMQTLVTEPFDREWYLEQYPDVANSGMDPYQHYLMSGKAEGRKPLRPTLFERQLSKLAPGDDDKPAKKKKGKAKPYVPRSEPLVTDDFDESFYLRYYPDIASSGVDPYEHFKSHGQAEGRFGKLPPLDLTPGRIAFDPQKETVLVVSHEASRTGAPILSLNIGQGLARKYNVVSLLCGPGPMVDAFLQESTYVLGPVKLRDEYLKTMLLMEQLVAALPLKFAVVNSIESRHVLEHLSKFGVPTVSLIHEFAAYTRPRSAFRDAIYWAGETVFSTPLTCDNALAEFPELADQSFNIAAQGRCMLHAEEADAESIEREDLRVRGRLRPLGDKDDAVVVIGAGFVQQRKGVDLFIDIAAKVLSSPGGRRFRFVWVGKGYDPENDLGYSVYLADQLRRHGLERDIVFMDETSRIDTVYAATDILLLSSRLDPLPNVAIDAMAHGLPVVCFENTTGIASVLDDAGLHEHCVADYLDTADAADKLLKLGAAPELRAEVGEKSKVVVAERFDMGRYLERLEEIADIAKERLQAEMAGVEAIVSSGLVRKDFFFRPNHVKMSLEDVVRFAYLRAWSTGIGRRKLFPGFHPGVYALHHPLGRNDDAMVEWLRHGRPDGPWMSPVVANTDPVVPLPADARVALHLHVYYADLLSEMLGRIGDNRVRPDLFISVPNERVAEEVRETLANYEGRVAAVQVVPNRGRDIGPLLTAFGPALLAGYDYVGHLHTKKTADLKDESVGKNWYRFLLENLLGGQAPMADAVLGRLAADPTLGLVFPDDPNVVSWGSNRPFAEAVAADLGVDELPEHFQLPVGTMFWARVEALRPLIEHGFDWADYPAEPLPYDGSLLHALERLFPLVAEAHGFRNAVTNVAGVTR